jgi:hypothetical protein
MSLIFSLIPFAFIAYYMFTVNKTKYVSSDLKIGEICYSCREKIEISEKERFENILNNKSNYRLCQSCKRDEKLDKIVNNSKLSRLNRFKLYLISDDYNKFAKILLGFLVVFCITDITLKVAFGIKGFTYFYNTFLACYWLLLIYRHKLISTKK